MSGWMSNNMNLRLHECITGRCLTAWKYDCMNASLGGVWLHESVIAWMHQWEMSDCIKAWRLQWVTGSAWLVNAWLCQCLTGGQSMPISSIFFFSLTNWVINTKLVPTKESLNNFTCMVANTFKPLLFHLAKSLWTRKIMVAFYHITSTVIINLEDYVQEDGYCKMKHHFWDYLLWIPAQPCQAVNKKIKSLKPMP